MVRVVAFVMVPFLEMLLLIWMGNTIGLWWTLGVVVATGTVGAALVKRQGVAVWNAARDRFRSGSLPARELAHGAMILVSGAFLLTPGVLTDLTGFALLVPAVRERIRVWLSRRYAGRFGGPIEVDVWR